MTLEEWWDTWDRPYRHAITEAIASLGEPRSILEVGCHCGVNFRLWRERWPNIPLVGIDKAKDAIKFGREKWTDDRKVQLYQQDMADLRFWDALPEPTCSVVVSCYALAYIEPNWLGDILPRLYLASRLGLVIAEPMAIDGLKSGPFANAPHEYRHDYDFDALLGVPGANWQRIDPPQDRMNAIATVRKGS